MLRVNEPDMQRPYRVPLYPLLPAAVILMSLIAAGAYGVYSPTEVLGVSSPQTVLVITLIMYAVGLAYYFLHARTRLASAAPEELAARAAADLTRST
jgi:ethanolamine permease